MIIRHVGLSAFFSTLTVQGAWPRAWMGVGIAALFPGRGLGVWPRAWLGVWFLLHFFASFLHLFCVFLRLFLAHSKKVCCHFLGGGCVCVEVSLRTACCCQKSNGFGDFCVQISDKLNPYQ